MLPAKKTYDPISAIEDVAAAVYFGHLAAQAEASLPQGSREVHLALTWLTAHVAHQGDRLWRARFEDLMLGEQQLGSWSISARLDAVKPDPVEIARRPWLAEDGRQVLAVAHSFAADESEKPDPEKGRKKIVDFAAALLAPCVAALSSPVRIRDMRGHQVVFSARQIHEIRLLGKKVSI